MLLSFPTRRYLIIGDLFDDVLWAEVLITQGLVAFESIILLHMFVTGVNAHSKAFYWLIVLRQAAS